MAEIVEKCPDLPQCYHEEDVIELHPTENISEELIMSNSNLDDSTETKRDSGIEDKDSYPNSPAGRKNNMSGKILCDVREKIQKNHAEEKSEDQIKRERHNAKEEKYGPKRSSTNAKSIAPNRTGFKPGNFQRGKRFVPKTRESSGGRPKMGPRETARQQQKQNSSSQPQKRPIVAFPKVAPPKPPHKAKRFSLKSNHSLNESILRSCGSRTMGFKLTDASFKGNKIVRETFENLKVTCKTAKKGKGKELWSRKVESPVAEAKREASRELLTLIQGKNSTIQDKENASKHLLGLIHGSKRTSKSSTAPKTPVPSQNKRNSPRKFRKTNPKLSKSHPISKQASYVTKTVSQLISAKIASEDPVNEPHPVSADFGEIPTVEPVENEEEIETDSIATTVQSVVEKTATVLKELYL